MQFLQSVYEYLLICFWEILFDRVYEGAGEVCCQGKGLGGYEYAR